eukprot:550058_1
MSQLIFTYSLIIFSTLLIANGIGLKNNRYPVFWNVDQKYDPAINISIFNILPRNYTQTGYTCSNQQDNCTQWKEGRWPMISAPDINNSSTWKFVNGGVPQAGNLSLHLQTIKETLPDWIPDPNWSGNAVLDFEAYSTIWDYNTHNTNAYYHWIGYQNISIELVKQQHPDWKNETQIISEAKSQFESAATIFFVETLKLCKSIRPNAKWGYYGLPMSYESPCINVKQDNNSSYYLCGYSSPIDGAKFRNYSDQQIKIYQYSDVIYPSIYNDGTQSSAKNIGYINNTIVEAFRCAKNAKQINYNLTGNDTYTLIYPYMLQRYHDYATFLSITDLNNSVVQPYNFGAHGLVIWGNGVENNASYWNYTNSTSGPFIENIVDVINTCAIKNCNNHGRCSGVNNSSCVCDNGYAGHSCNITMTIMQ